ncbi:MULTISPECIES: SHOCT domain-containing protein [unclassified Streptomyces]|uniref:SHOCT domain-containing protein n=1 Tax=unclassified Streptomyces TaxID=2593676 RepID=UPI002DDA5D61|nr:SHOCT domain-containing protein [Streptomyces sp. NBC_01237]WRZ70965.1 SHOCT domain-containing protein [Streptomyces sp. NBC_01237]
MNTLAYDGGPGPWILLFPILWAAVVVGVVTLLRRTVWRSRRGPWQGAVARTPLGAPGEPSPIALLGRRFAAGEIDEDEYWRRLSVLDEQFGPGAHGRAA